jgi:hypothetical protein
MGYAVTTVFVVLITAIFKRIKELRKGKVAKKEDAAVPKVNDRIEIKKAKKGKAKQLKVKKGKVKQLKVKQLKV